MRPPQPQATQFHPRAPRSTPGSRQASPENKRQPCTETSQRQVRSDATPCSRLPPLRDSSLDVRGHLARYRVGGCRCPTFPPCSSYMARGWTSCWAAHVPPSECHASDGRPVSPAPRVLTLAQPSTPLECNPAGSGRAEVPTIGRSGWVTLFHGVDHAAPDLLQVACTLSTRDSETRSASDLVYPGQRPYRIESKGVELRGFEPLTPTLPVWCATNCATAPYSGVNLRVVCAVRYLTPGRS